MGRTSNTYPTIDCTYLKSRGILNKLHPYPCDLNHPNFIANEIIGFKVCIIFTTFILKTFINHAIIPKISDYFCNINSFQVTIWIFWMHGTRKPSFRKNQRK